MTEEILIESSHNSISPQKSPIQPQRSPSPDVPKVESYDWIRYEED